LQKEAAQGRSVSEHREEPGASVKGQACPVYHCYFTIDGCDYFQVVYKANLPNQAKTNQTRRELFTYPLKELWAVRF
jgi:hypothetical protein